MAREGDGGGVAPAALPPLCRPLATRGDKTTWSPSSAKCVLNVALDARFVEARRSDVDVASSRRTPSSSSSSVVVAPAGCRVSTSHVVALDGVIDDAMRDAFLRRITSDADADGDGEGGPAGPRWERRTADRNGASPTWGLTRDALRDIELEHSRNDDAFVEFHSRLQAMYPEWIVAHMPADALERAPTAEEDDGVDDDDDDDGGARERRYRCDAFVANAATRGDDFAWHLDADPSSFDPESAWVEAYGDYVNGEPGKPLFVSALVYLNAEWKPEWDAETMFADSDGDGGGVGAFVRPAPGRLVLMDQDVRHRVSPPSVAAGGRARFSLVWKLVFFPRGGARAVAGRARAAGIAREAFGRPSPLGSAAKLAAIEDAMRRGAKRSAAEEAKGDGDAGGSGGLKK